MTSSVQKSIHEADASGIPDRRRIDDAGWEGGGCVCVCVRPSGIARQVGFFFDEDQGDSGESRRINSDRDKRRTLLCEPNSLALATARRRATTTTHDNGSTLYSLLLEAAPK